MYSPASSSEGVCQFSELAKMSSRSDMVLGVRVSDPDVEPSEVWQKFCWNLESPGVSRMWDAG